MKATRLEALCAEKVGRRGRCVLKLCSWAHRYIHMPEVFVLWSHALWGAFKSPSRTPGPLTARVIRARNRSNVSRVVSGATYAATIETPSTDVAMN